jgi:hypothetical protein
VTVLPVENLAPDHFVFWTPPVGATVLAGAERQAMELPAFPLPVHCRELQEGIPSDAAIGQGVYDYLRQFPDCEGNILYAELLRDAYPHFITDLAAHAVMLDAKQVEPSYVFRKLTCLKILFLLDRRNSGLLLQLCRGFFELSLEFIELAGCRQHLRDAMKFGQELLAVDAENPQALSLLAEIDLLFGDAPAAVNKWRRLAAQVGDPAILARIDTRIAACAFDDSSDTTLVDELESVAEAMHLQTLGDHGGATCLLERIEETGRLTSILPSADFFWLLGVCRRDSGDIGGAFVALEKALALEPEHPAAKAALNAL